MQVHGPGYRLPKKGLRTLHIEGTEYSYQIKGSRVLFFLETAKIEADFTEVTGLPSNTIERGQWKGTQDGAVTPQRCKEFLQRYLEDSLIGL